MKLKLNKKQQREIAKIKKLIDKNRITEGKIVEGFITSMHLKTDKEAEIIWDYIYNNSTWMELNFNETQN